MLELLQDKIFLKGHAITFYEAVGAKSKFDNINDVVLLAKMSFMIPYDMSKKLLVYCVLIYHLHSKLQV